MTLSPSSAKNVRYLRDHSHMSQGTLAILIGTSAYNIRKIENAKGLICMDSRIFARLCEVFGVEMRTITRVDLSIYQMPVYLDPPNPSVMEIPYDPAEKAVF